MEPLNYIDDQPTPTPAIEGNIAEEAMKAFAAYALHHEKGDYWLRITMYGDLSGRVEGNELHFDFEGLKELRERLRERGF